MRSDVSLAGRWTVVVAALAAGAPVASPQTGTGTLFALGDDAISKVLTTVDVDTGVQTPVGGSSSTGFAGGVLDIGSALDAQGNRFFFFGGKPDTMVFTVDTQTGATVQSPVVTGLASNPISAEYEASAGRLLVLVKDAAEQALLARIDPVTGVGAALTPQDQDLFAGPVLNAVSALDDAGGRFFFIGADEVGRVLQGFDTSDGTPLASVPLKGVGDAFTLEYDDVAGALLGVADDDATGEKVLVRIDPATGVQTAVGAGTGFTGGTAGFGSALDAVHGRYYFVGVEGVKTPVLATVDTQTGALIAKPPFAGGFNVPLSLEFAAPDTPGPECFLIVGTRPLDLPLPFSPHDSLFVQPDLLFPVTGPFDVPVFQIPDDPILLGVHVYAQVYMDNAILFPDDRYKVSNGLDVVLGVGAGMYGQSTGMLLYLVDDPLLGGVLSCGFVIQ